VDDESRAAADPRERTPLRVPTLVVIGGGPDGALYVRQLLRAAAAGRLHADRILVVDRDPACLAGAQWSDPRVAIEVAAWDDWLDARLSGLGASDHLVPYHWAPHLLVGWLARELERAGLAVRRGGGVPPRGLPFERETAQGDRALSFATWSCPPTCIEPALCPHTRGPRDWSLAQAAAATRPEDPWDEAIVLPSLHLVWGVATIPVRAIHAARDRAVLRARAGRCRWLVTTASHCHGLATLLEAGPPPARAEWAAAAPGVQS
jgi:hypothetical protein